MKIAAITITYNRLELTKKMVESFYSKTSVDYHLFVDNGSIDGTREYIKQFNHIQLDKNYGIAYAFACGVNVINDYDYILKLDNDIEIISSEILEKMAVIFRYGKFVVSPTDLLLDPAFAPRSQGKLKIGDYNIEYVTHTGGAFQLIPINVCKQLVSNYKALSRGDYAIGAFYKSRGYRPAYMRDFEIRHTGLNQSTPVKEYIM